MRALILVLLLAGCAGSPTGPLYHSQAQTIIYHHHEAFGNAASIDLNINGKQCTLHNDGFAVLPVGAIVTATMFARPGASVYKLTNAKYIRVEVDMRKQEWLAASWIGGEAAEATSDHSGPVRFSITNEPIYNLHQDCL